MGNLPLPAGTYNFDNNARANMSTGLKTEAIA